jgi:hypothetical protein
MKVAGRPNFFDFGEFDEAPTRGTEALPGPPSAGHRDVHGIGDGEVRSGVNGCSMI